MDDIDRELKQIQLQRERLALKRELERSEWKANTVGIVGRGLSFIVGAAQAAVGGIVAFVKRRWKWPALLILGSAMAYGGFEWKEMHEQAQLDASKAKYQTERERFVNLRCADNICNRPPVDIHAESSCLSSRLLHRTCEGDARGEFFKLKGAEPSR